MTPTTIDITPNYPAVYKRFIEAFEYAVTRTVKKARSTEDLRELRERLVELNIAVQSVDSLELFADFRDRLHKSVSDLCDRYDALSDSEESEDGYEPTSYFGPDGKVRERL